MKKFYLQNAGVNVVLMKSVISPNGQAAAKNYNRKKLSPEDVGLEIRFDRNGVEMTPEQRRTILAVIRKMSDALLENLRVDSGGEWQPGTVVTAEPLINLEILGIDLLSSTVNTVELVTGRKQVLAGVVQRDGEHTIMLEQIDDLCGSIIRREIPKSHYQITEQEGKGIEGLAIFLLFRGKGGGYEWVHAGPENYLSPNTRLKLLQDFAKGSNCLDKDLAVTLAEAIEGEQGLKANVVLRLQENPEHATRVLTLVTNQEQVQRIARELKKPAIGNALSDALWLRLTADDQETLLRFACRGEYFRHEQAGEERFATDSLETIFKDDKHYVGIMRATGPLLEELLERIKYDDSKQELLMELVDHIGRYDGLKFIKNIDLLEKYSGYGMRGWGWSDAVKERMTELGLVKKKPPRRPSGDDGPC